MKIIFVTNTLSYGGAAKVVSKVASSFAIDDNEVHVITLEKHDPVQKLSKKITVHHLYTTLNIKIIKRFAILIKLFRTICSIRPSVLVSFLTYPNAYTTICGKILRVPVIISERGDPFIGKQTSPLLYRIMNFADGAVFQTEHARSAFCCNLQKKSVVIPNPIDGNNHLHPLYKKNYKIVHIARFENKQKRQDLMIEAFTIVKSRIPKATLHFYGAGQDEEYIQNLAKKSKYTSDIFFHGFTSDVPRVLQDCNVFVLTSDYEGSPNAMIEAMSQGIPVVATDCSPGGAKTLIEATQSGLLAERGNAENIADNISKLLESYEESDKHARAALSINEIYNICGIQKAWSSYIRKHI